MTFGFGYSQTSDNAENEMWYKLSPEIRINFENSPWEVRWRPDDHLLMPEKYIGKNGFARIDLMIGCNFKPFKIFSYTKTDEFERAWTGARIDWNGAFINKKLLVNLQTRYFFGLNERSDDHYYLVQFIRYKLSKNLRTGILSYGKWAADEPFNEGYWFIGPSANIVLPYKFNLHIAVTKSIFHDNIYMTFIRLGYKIKAKTNK